jgi:hypothetical protein
LIQIGSHPQIVDKPPCQAERTDSADDAAVLPAMTLRFGFIYVVPILPTIPQDAAQSTSFVIQPDMMPELKWFYFSKHMLGMIILLSGLTDLL